MDEYAEMVDEVVVYPVLRAAREMLQRENADASHLEWVPDGIWPVAGDAGQLHRNGSGWEVVG